MARPEGVGRWAAAILDFKAILLMDRTILMSYYELEWSILGELGYHFLEDQEPTRRRTMQKESQSLESLLGGKVSEFFVDVWQQSCAIFALPHELSPSSSPLQTLIQNGWNVTLGLMEQQTYHQGDEPPIIFRNREMVDLHF